MDKLQHLCQFQWVRSIFIFSALLGGDTGGGGRAWISYWLITSSQSKTRAPITGRKGETESKEKRSLAPEEEVGRGGDK